MSWASDVKEQWAGLPTWGKALIIGGVGIVAFLVIKSMASPGGRSQPSLGGDSAESGAPVGRSIFPSVQSGQSNVPLLPPGVSPIFSGGGQLVGFQQGGMQQATQPTAPSTFKVGARGLWAGETGSSGGIPIWKSPNANWDEVVTSVPKNAELQVGTSVQGNYFGQSATYYPVTVDGKTGYIGSWDLGNAPPVSGAPASYTPTGGGGRSWQSMFSRLDLYVPQIGDNMNEVAAQLGLRGGWKTFGVNSFEHGKGVKIPR